MTLIDSFPKSSVRLSQHTTRHTHCAVTIQQSEALLVTVDRSNQQAQGSEQQFPRLPQSLPGTSQPFLREPKWTPNSAGSRFCDPRAALALGPGLFFSPLLFLHQPDPFFLSPRRHVHASVSGWQGCWYGQVGRQRLGSVPCVLSWPGLPAVQ